MIKIRWVFGLGGLLSLIGCDLMEHRSYHDPRLKLQKEDYEKLAIPPRTHKPLPSYRSKSQASSKGPSLTAGMNKKISVTLQETIPLKTVLIELGRQTGVGIALSPQIEAHTLGLSYSVYQVPFIQAIKDICTLTHHRFHIQGNRILIEPDDPYLVTYTVDFLNNVRKIENKISVSTNVFSPVDHKNGSENGSDSILSGNAHVDFWAELGQNLKMILGAEVHPSKTSPSYTLHKQGGAYHRSRDSSATRTNQRLS